MISQIFVLQESHLGTILNEFLATKLGHTAVLSKWK